MSRRLIIARLIGVIVASVLTSAVQSQNLFEQLVMPGPVVDGHAKLEKDCGKCHEPFSRRSQTRLCLDCHKDIAADRTAGKGFHGRRPDTAKQECNHCHTDHKGRNADSSSEFDRETFNHAFTNFELRDAHKAMPCAGCHVPTIKFRKAPGRCSDCHKANDPHKGRLGEKCDDCHGEAKWREVRHSTTTRPDFRSRVHIQPSPAPRAILANATRASAPYAWTATGSRMFTPDGTAPNAKAATTRTSGKRFISIMTRRNIH